MSWLQIADAIKGAIEPNAPIVPETTVHVGWPNPQTLIDIMRGSARKGIISIFPFGPGRAIHDYGYIETVCKFPSELVAVFTDNTLTLSGIIRAKDNLFVFVNNYPFQHTIIAGDTFGSILNNIASQINNSSLGVVGTVNGAQLVLDGVVYCPRATTHGYGTVTTEVARMARLIMATAWAQNPIDRDILANAIYSSVFSNSNLGGARFIFSHDNVMDAMMPSGIMRQDVVGEAEYGVQKSEDLSMVGCPIVDLEVINAGILHVTVNPVGCGCDDTAIIHQGPSPSPGSGVPGRWVKEKPIGRPSDTFQLSYPPMDETILLVVNNQLWEETLAILAPGYFSVANQILTTGRVLDAEPVDRVWMMYQTAD